jgi:two-component system nitrogen regulation response regulator NtrX
MTSRILVVDDDKSIRAALRQMLEYEGHEVREASSGGEAITLYPEYRPQAVFLDVKMAGLDGMDTLSQLCGLDPGAVVIMISGHGTISTALEATRRGAFDFLEKPLDTDRTLVTLRNALQQGSLLGDVGRFQEELEGRYKMVGEGAALSAVRETIERVAATDGRVLIQGENGTGKELVARAIHFKSARRTRPFVEVNCAAIPAELIESELFGHMKGSFTGAVGDRPGKFELAHSGTLFLDEVGDMALPAQAKVLRALQEGVVTRIGGARPIQVDVRIVAATNKKLGAEIAMGRFRKDLFYRLNVVPITVPPLRERAEDIPDLVAHFARQLDPAPGAAAKKFDDSAVAALRRRTWPGNVRELRNAVERLLILTPTKLISSADVTRLLGLSSSVIVPDEDEVPIDLSEPSYAAFRDATDRKYLQAKLAEHDYNVTETAVALGLPRSNLYKKITALNLKTKAP